MILCGVYSFFGTIILRNLDKRTPLAVGFLLGMGVMLVQVLLTLAVTSGGGVQGSKPASVRAAPRARAPPALIAALPSPTAVLTPHALPARPLPLSLPRLAPWRPSPPCSSLRTPFS